MRQLSAFNEQWVFKPDYLEAHYNLGNALRTQGRLDEAVECYREAVAYQNRILLMRTTASVLCCTFKESSMKRQNAFKQVVQMRPNSSLGA